MSSNLSATGPNVPLRLLSLESSGQAGSVAAFEGNKLLLQRCLEDGQRSAQSLSPAIRDLLLDVDWRPADVRFVAVTTGPGSFTGLRVGVTTAKTFAYAVSAGVIGVNTLAAIVECSAPAAGPTWAVIDAQRGELFAARFWPASATGWQVDIPTKIVSRQDWLASLRAGDHITGPAVASLLERLPAEVAVAPESTRAPNAASVGRIALQRYHAGERDDLWQLTPQYFRRSAAEEKWEKEHTSQK